MVTLPAALNPFAAKPTLASTPIIDLRVYPVKSCRGILLKETTLVSSGLDLDRRWMFMDRAKDNRFVTIREVSALTLIDTAFASSRPSPVSPGSADLDKEDDLDLVLTVRTTGASVRVPARPTPAYLEAHTALESVTIWGTQTDAHVYGESVNGIFTELVGHPVALVYKGPTARLSEGSGAPDVLGRAQAINFPDMMPVLVANLASLEELNERLAAKGVETITVERFRPNIIVQGSSEGEELLGPWAEDAWKTVRVATGQQEPAGWFSGPAEKKLVLDVACRCLRCQVPNVDPETAVKHKKEPWDTLMSYRRVDPGLKFKPAFGMLCAPREGGKLKVGMSLEVVETTTGHVFGKAPA